MCAKMREGVFLDRTQFSSGRYKSQQQWNVVWGTTMANAPPGLPPAVSLFQSLLFVHIQMFAQKPRKHLAGSPRHLTSPRFGLSPA